jgi:hypothetical protein
MLGSLSTTQFYKTIQSAAPTFTIRSTEFVSPLSDPDAVALARPIFSTTLLESPPR